MLSERVQKLLTAAVDGELTDRERRALNKLLGESTEARDVYQRLQRDAKKLRELPRATLPAHYSSLIIQSLHRPSPTIPTVVAQTAQKYLPIWANLAAALGVLIALATGTYLVVRLNEQQENAKLAGKNAKPIEPANPASNGSTPEIIRGSNKPSPEGPDILPLPRDHDDFASVPMPELPDPPEPENKTALTVPFNPKLELFKVDMPKLPPIIAVRELEHAVQRSVLRDSMKSDDAIHIDLFCKDANKGFERVLNTLKAQGHRTLVEALAQFRLQSRVKTNYVIYAETLNVEDVVRLFTAVAADERKMDSKLLEKLVVTSMSLTDQKTLAALLGLDPKLLQIKPKTVTKLDPQKPLSDLTAEALARALAEKERAANAGLTKPGEALALALSFNPVRPHPMLSREVREFLANRKERKPGTPAIMLIIRNVD